MKTRLIIQVIHNLSSCENKPEKNSNLNGIPTTDGLRYRLLHQLSIKPTECWSRCEFVMYP